MKNLLRALVFIFLFPAAGLCSDPAEVPQMPDVLGEISVSESRPLTLKDCYSLALKQSELIAMRAQVIREAEAHFLQALSIVLPNVSFSSTDTRQDVSSSSSYSRNIYERKFVFKQTLFSGFKAFAGITGSRIERNQRVNEKRRAEQLLFTDVSDAFYLLLQQREYLKTLLIIKNALSSRIAELQDRERIGKSRHSETVNVRAQLYRIEADFQVAESREALVRQLLEFLTGTKIGGILDPFDNFWYLGPEDIYTAKAAQRPDVLAAFEASEVAGKKVMIAKSGFLPTVSVEGNYYTARNTAFANSKWDAKLDVDVPIFDGAKTLGDVKEARAKLRESELEFSRVKRLAVTDIKDAYVQFRHSLLRVKALTKALSESDMNYDLQRQDYRMNLVNNLDVLDAIRTMGESRRDYVQALYEAKRNYWQLKVATGEIPQEIVK